MAEKKNGPGKGNRTRGANRRGNLAGHPGNPIENQNGIIEANAAKAEKAEHYKRIAEQQAKVIKYGQEYAGQMLDSFNAYIIEQRNQHRPLTIAGLIRASGVSADTYYRYRNGDADHMLYEYMDRYGIDYSEEGNQVVNTDGEQVLLVRLSDVVKRAELAVQEQLEENCYTNKGNPAGSIFGLKARYDWQDTPPDQRTTNNNTLVLNNVATLEEAKEAMKRLNG